MINRMEDTAVDMLAESRRALHDPNEVINEHINMGNWARVEEEQGL